MRKYLLRTLLLTVLIASFFVITAFAEDAVVVGSDVNLRSGPGTNYAVLDCLPKGTTVTVNDRSNSQWYSVTYKGRTGFISARYLSLVTEEAPSGEILVDDGGISVDAPAATATPAATPKPSSGSSSGSSTVTVVSDAPAPTSTPKPSTSSSSGTAGTINAMYVRFRSKPSTSSTILGTYNRGTALTITGTSGDWTACTIGGKSGYVYSSYVTKSSGSPAPAATPAPTAAPKPTATPKPSDEITVEAPAATPKPTATPAPTPTPAPAGSKAATITGDYVRFRSKPSTSSTILGTYDRGKQIAVTGTSGDWTACVIDGKSGYVYSQYVSLKETGGSSGGSDVVVETPKESTASEPGYIKGNNVRLRSGPSTSSSILDELNSGTAVTITGKSGDWTAVTVGKKSGYVYSSYVAKGTISVSSGSSSSGSSVGAKAAEMALKYVGYNYKWGGTSPSTGFDCSGLMYYVYGQLGYKLPRVANDQASYGKAVSLEDIQPGDIICFYSGSNYVGHVGMYIGDNKFVHASTSTTGVIISELIGTYVRRGFVIRRVA